MFGLVGALALGAMVFLQLDSSRNQMESQRAGERTGGRKCGSPAACSLDHSCRAAHAGLYARVPTS